MERMEMKQRKKIAEDEVKKDERWTKLCDSDH